MPVVSHDAESEGNERQLRSIAKKLNSLELPGMVEACSKLDMLMTVSAQALSLSSVKHLEIVEMALRLADLVLQASPTETAVEIGHDDWEHPHSQGDFLDESK